LRKSAQGLCAPVCDYDIDLATFMDEVVLPDCPRGVRARTFDGRDVLIRPRIRGSAGDRMVFWHR